MLFLFHFHQVTHGAHHAHDLGGVFVFHWVVEFLQSESLDGLFLTLGAVDGTAHLSDDNFAHDQKDYPLNTLVTGMPRNCATSWALRNSFKALNVAFTTL